MVQSFFVYGLLGFILFFFGRFSEKRQMINISNGIKTPFLTWEITLVLLFFATISGIRWNVGVDHLTYFENYITLQNAGYSLFEKELAFEGFTRFLATSGVHFTIYFGLLALLQIFFIYMAFEKDRFLYPFLGIIIVFGSHYLDWMNGIRQMIVACIFVFSIRFIFQRKWISYFFLIFLCSFIHQSAFILFLVYFIPNRDYFSNTKLTILAVVVSLYLGSNIFWIELLSEITDLFFLLGYEKYTPDQIDLFITERRDMNFGPRRLSIIFLALITILFAPRLKERFLSSNFLTYYNFAILGFLLYNLLSNTHHAFIRPVTYFTIFSVPTTAYLLVYLKERMYSKNFLIFIIVLFLSTCYLPLSIVADYGKGQEDYSNFKFYWDYENRL